ncbi:hypothetical protein GCM10010497_44150 [Streptomyces cinereoruber]|uniref:Uncharacterized protein n=1 Tax=Streptomyces cinereoruber TaxID=67260 RepID=A0AAV4KL55_9ACTN|nr:hypothetical protein GCM10010497_44150 [Streptomyces cinereoruber]
MAPDVHAERALVSGHRGDRRVGGRHRPPGRPEEALPGLREAHSPAVAQEQPGAEQGFEARDPLGQGLLGDAQRFGRPPEVQLLGGAYEGAHLRHVEIHGPHPRRQPVVVGGSLPLLERRPGAGFACPSCRD